MPEVSSKSCIPGCILHHVTSWSGEIPAEGHITLNPRFENVKRGKKRQRDLKASKRDLEIC